jgi:hypothetical protein
LTFNKSLVRLASLKECVPDAAITFNRKRPRILGPAHSRKRHCLSLSQRSIAQEILVDEEKHWHVDSLSRLYSLLLEAEALQRRV